MKLLNKEEVIKIIRQSENPYPLDLIEGGADFRKIAKLLRKKLDSKSHLVEAFAWAWGNYVYEKAKIKLEKEITEL